MDPFGIPAHIPLGPDTFDSNGVETTAAMDSNGTEEEGADNVVSCYRDAGYRPFP